MTLNRTWECSRFLPWSSPVVYHPSRSHGYLSVVLVSGVSAALHLSSHYGHRFHPTPQYPPEWNLWSVAMLNGAPHGQNEEQSRSLSVELMSGLICGLRFHFLEYIEHLLQWGIYDGQKWFRWGRWNTDDTVDTGISSHLSMSFHHSKYHLSNSMGISLLLSILHPWDMQGNPLIWGERPFLQVCGVSHPIPRVVCNSRFFSSPMIQREEPKNK